MGVKSGEGFYIQEEVKAEQISKLNLYSLSI
jgi:hypothetical protein